MSFEALLSSVKPPVLLPACLPSIRMVDVQTTKDERCWTFHYSDGTFYQTRDPDEAQARSYEAFPVLKKENT